MRPWNSCINLTALSAVSFTGLSKERVCFAFKKESLLSHVEGHSFRKASLILRRAKKSLLLDDIKSSMDLSEIKKMDLIEIKFVN